MKERETASLVYWLQERPKSVLYWNHSKQHSSSSSSNWLFLSVLYYIQYIFFFFSVACSLLQKTLKGIEKTPKHEKSKIFIKTKAKFINRVITFSTHTRVRTSPPQQKKKKQKRRRKKLYVRFVCIQQNFEFFFHSFVRFVIWFVFITVNIRSSIGLARIVFALFRGVSLLVVQSNRPYS